VTGIGYEAFSGCTSLASTAIPGSVTSIGYYAFSDCTSLESVVIHDGVTSIGDRAFFYCTSLASVNIPGSVTSIGMYAFVGCTSLARVSIPGSVTSIGNSAFYGCTSLASIDIPGSVTSIDDYTFHGCTSLASVAIPNSVTSIGNRAFLGCISLTGVTIPGSVTSIGTEAFWNCTSLESVIIHDGVASIGNYAFSYCASLASVTIPGSVASIGTEVFRGCTSLASVSIPDSVTSIGNSAFYGCNSLTNVTIPRSVTSIGSSALANCPNVVVYCYENSRAYTYASSNNIPFVLIYDVTITASATMGGAASGGRVYIGGDTVTLTATPDSGYRFEGWYEDGARVSANSTYTFTAEADRTLEARFTEDEVPLPTYFTITATATAGGTVTGGGSYGEDSTVTLTATANDGYHFTGWYEGETLVSSDLEFAFTATVNRTLKARFAADEGEGDDGDDNGDDDGDDGDDGGDGDDDGDDGDDDGGNGDDEGDDGDDESDDGDDPVTPPIAPQPSRLAITPGYALVETGKTVTLTLSATPGHADLTNIAWYLDGQLIADSSGKETINLTPNTVGTREVSAILIVSGRAVCAAYAQIRVHEPEAGFAATLLANKVTVNRAATSGAMLPLRLSRAAEESTPIKLTDAKGAELANFMAELLPDHKTVEIKPKPGVNPKSASKVTVWVGGEKAKGPNGQDMTISIAVATSYPKITLSAESLDLYDADRPAAIFATASDGTEVTVSKVEISGGNRAADVTVVGNQLQLKPGAAKTGSVKVRVTLASTEYGNLSKKGNTFTATVKIANSKANVKAPSKAGALATKGKIDIVNPQSAIAVKISAADAAANPVGENNVTLKKPDGKVSEQYFAEFVDAQTFLIKAIPGGGAAPGVKTALTVEIGEKRYEKPVSVTPIRSATKAFQSKKAITLYKDRPAIGEELALGFTAPNNARLGEVTIDPQFNGKNFAAGGFAVVRTSADTWALRFDKGKAPESAKNGSTLKLPKTYTVKLQLWPEGTYTLDQNHNPVPLGSKAKPTVISVKVTVR
jgi:uncharacterized repeat protein (TIGR02543 family)